MSIQQTTEEFIGRDQEKTLFIEWLDNAQASRIFSIYDFLEEKGEKGGVGKTWLLNEYMTFVSRHRKNIVPVLIDFLNVAERDGIEVANQVVKQLQSRFPAWLPQSFAVAQDEYHNACLSGNRDMPRLLDQLGNALATDLRTLHTQFLDGDGYILIFFDTFELVEPNPLTAVLRSHCQFPDDYGFEQVRFVIAGRNALDFQHSQWLGRQDEVLSLSLKPFTYDEMMQYLNTRSNVVDLESKVEQMQAIYARTQGRPILIGLVADVLNYRRSDLNLDTLTAAPNPSEFMKALIEQILFFDNTPKMIIFYMAHLRHRFNTTLLSMILSKLSPTGLQDTQELLTSLLGLSFVRRSRNLNDFMLHDEVLRLINQYCWPIQDPRNRIRRELSDLAIQYYKNMLETETNPQICQSYIVEKLFHELFRNREAGIKLFEQQFNTATDQWMIAFARSLLQEARLFEKELHPEQLYFVIMAEAKLLRVEENPSGALKLYTRLEHEAEWFPHHHLEILREKGKCFQQTSQFSEAIAAFEACLAIEELQEQSSIHADILNELGYIYKLRGELMKALHSYNSSLSVQRASDNPHEYAETLNSLGNIYRLQGKTEQAFQHCKIALRIRRELLQEGKSSERHIALSQSTIGQIYLDLAEVVRGRDDITRAEACFQEAFEIYSRIGYKRGIAATYNRFGQVQMRKEHWEEAMNLFVMAYDTSLATDVETRIISLDRQGRVLSHQGKLQEAATSFRQAIELAQRTDYWYEEVESLIDLAETLDRAGETIDDVLEKALRTAYKQGYYSLIGYAEDVAGLASYKEKEYRKAFKHFITACRYMALCSNFSYTKHLRDLFDRLLEIPVTHLPGIVDLLSSYWQDIGLEESHPELLDICKSVSKHIVL